MNHVPHRAAIDRQVRRRLQNAVFHLMDGRLPRLYDAAVYEMMTTTEEDITYGGCWSASTEGGCWWAV
jgi:hypothetical protein